MQEIWKSHFDEVCSDGLDTLLKTTRLVPHKNAQDTHKADSRTNLLKIPLLPTPYYVAF